MNLLNLLTNLYVAPAPLSAGACPPTTSLVEKSWLLYFVCRMSSELKAFLWSCVPCLRRCCHVVEKVFFSVVPKVLVLYGYASPFQG